MKKYMRSPAGILTGLILCTALSGSGLASFYDQETDTLDGKLLFPGDSMRTETNVWVAPDMTYCELSDHIWTNTDTERAYRISLYENPELGESGLLVRPEGYVVTVIGGESTSDDGITGTHSADSYQEEPISEGEERQPVLTKDVASYPDSSWVHIKATGAGEGWHFGHWEFEPQIYLEDIASEELSFLMPAHGLKIKAVYAEGEAVPQESNPEDASGEMAEDQNTDGAEAPEEGELPEAEIYEGEDAVPEAEAYAAEGDYAEAEAYAAEGDYAEAEGDYAEAEEYAAEGDYAEAEAYAAEEDYAEAEEYAAEGDYAEAEAYAAEGEYAEAEAYAAEEDYAEAGGYEENIAAEAEEYAAEGGSIQTFSVIVENGSGSGSYEVGDLVSIAADVQRPGTFRYWSTEYDTVWLENTDAVETAFYMPAENVVVTAVFDEGAAEPEQAAEEIPQEAAEPEQTAEEIPQEAAVEERAAEPEQIEIAEEMVAEPAAQIEEAAAEPEMAVQETPAGQSAQIEEAAPEQAVQEAQAEPGSQIGEAAAPEQGAQEIPQEEAAKEKAAAAETYYIYTESEEILVNGAEAGDETKAEAGSVVALSASGLNDAKIEEWIITNEETGEIISYEEEEDEDSILFVMPAAEVSVDLRYSQILKNTVEVTNGSGSGTYEEGDEVTIEASPAPEGQRFKMWMITTGDISLDDTFSPKTAFTMGEESVFLQAVYEPVTYTLTVNSGTGDGKYYKGDSVNISADWPADGKEFASWHSDQVTVDSADRYYAGLVMPAADVTVSASYQDGPSAAYNRIDGLADGGEYLKDTKLTFTAVGNGPDKPNPNPGDFKWVPASYQIGTVSGGWSGSDYSTSMSISAVGQYTLTVVFVKQIFDGNIWTITSQTDQKSVSFYVVNALAVQTGDTTPVLPFVVAAVAALAVIAGILIYRRRR